MHVLSWLCMGALLGGHLASACSAIPRVQQQRTRPAASKLAPHRRLKSAQKTREQKRQKSISSHSPVVVFIGWMIVISSLACAARRSALGRTRLRAMCVCSSTARYRAEPCTLIRRWRATRLPGTLRARKLSPTHYTLPVLCETSVPRVLLRRWTEQSEQLPVRRASRSSPMPGCGNREANDAAAQKSDAEIIFLSGSVTIEALVYVLFFYGGAVKTERT